MAWQELFSTPTGLFSVFTIAVVLVIGAVMGRYYASKMKEEGGARED